ncbi:MAG: putative signal transducing protein [Thermoanaerobaculia bacterium]
MAESRQDIPADVNTITADDGTTWVEIASTGTEDEAALLCGFLDAAGIPAQSENVKFKMEPINFGAMGEIRVYVPSEHEERAQQLLRERDREYEQLDDDEETLITDEGPAVVDESTEAAVEVDDGTTNA